MGMGENGGGGRRGKAVSPSTCSESNILIALFFNCIIIHIHTVTLS